MTWQQLVETGKNRKGLVKTRIRPSFFKKNILAQVMTKTMTIICKQLMCDSFYLVQKKSFILKFNVAISVLFSKKIVTKKFPACFSSFWFQFQAFG